MNPAVHVSETTTNECACIYFYYHTARSYNSVLRLGSILNKGEEEEEEEGKTVAAAAPSYICQFDEVRYMGESATHGGKSRSMVVGWLVKGEISQPVADAEK
jgi:hypothetical protein